MNRAERNATPSADHGLPGDDHDEARSLAIVAEIAAELEFGIGEPEFVARMVKGSASDAPHLFIDEQAIKFHLPDALRRLAGKIEADRTKANQRKVA